MSTTTATTAARATTSTMFNANVVEIVSSAAMNEDSAISIFFTENLDPKHVCLIPVFPVFPVVTVVTVVTV